MTPDVVCVGGLFIDDIVFPDGRTQMGVIGGGITHAAMGARVWDVRPSVCMVAGKDAPPHAKDFMAANFETTGLRWLDASQARAWQLFEWDGRRTELYRVDDMQPYLVEPLPEHFPAAYRETRGLCILKNGGAEVSQWRQAAPDAVLLWEPMQQYMIAANHDEFRATLPVPDIVSPNWLEASLVYGFDDPDRLVDTMLADGAKRVALRMGEQGSIVADAAQRVRVPAVPVPEVIDQTGAGNSYCGGLLVGWLRSSDLWTAGCYGAVSASFCLEEIGVIHWDERMIPTRDERLAALLTSS